MANTQRINILVHKNLQTVMENKPHRYLERSFMMKKLNYLSVFAYRLIRFTPRFIRSGCCTTSRGIIAIYNYNENSVTMIILGNFFFFIEGRLFMY